MATKNYVRLILLNCDNSTVVKKENVFYGLETHTAIFRTEMFIMSIVFKENTSVTRMAETCWLLTVGNEYMGAHHFSVYARYVFEMKVKNKIFPSPNG